MDSSETAESNFDSVYRAHYTGVHQFVFRLVNDKTLADDLTQDTFVKAYRAWDGFRGDASVRTWLYRIARNVSLDHFRDPRSRGQPQTFDGSDGETQRSEPEPSVASTVRTIEMTSCVREFVADLPETLRVPLILHDLEGFNNAEIADLLECSLGAAKMRLHRARRKLQGMLEERCDLFRDERDVLSCLPGSPDTSAPTFGI